RLPHPRRRTGRRDRIAEPSRTAVRHGFKICSLWLLASPWLDPYRFWEFAAGLRDIFSVTLGA
ncbi:MAG: hypothetical protein ACRDPY_48470, partial [Streptosporangiaceae bacterium]